MIRDLGVGNGSYTNSTRNDRRSSSSGTWGWVDGFLAASPGQKSRDDDTDRLVAELNQKRPGTPDGGF